MALTIKVGGKKTTTAKKTTTKPAKRGPGRPKGSTNKTSTAKKTTTSSNGHGRRTTQWDQSATQKRLVKALEKAGDKRLKLHEQHKEAVAELAEAAREALEAGVPMGVVHENAQISRQWLYKIDSHSGRPDAAVSNGGGRETTTRKTTARSASTAKTKKVGKKITIRK